MKDFVKSIKDKLLIKNEQLPPNLESIETEEVYEEDSIGAECMPYFDSEFL